jgi:hypothetical protein
MEKKKTIPEQVEEIKYRVNRPDLVINRVPKKTLSWFIEWCKEEFEGDYGMGLKWLGEDHMPPENVILVEKVMALEADVEQLKMILAEQPKQEENNGIVTGSGKRINRRK